jgi:hypothetical protein
MVHGEVDLETGRLQTDRGSAAAGEADADLAADIGAANARDLMREETVE